MKTLSLFAYLVLTGLDQSSAQLSNYTDLTAGDEASSMLPCVLKLVEQYFISEKAMKGSLAIVGLTKDPSVLEQAVVKILNEDERHKMGVMVKDATKYHFSPVHVTETASNYLILISNSTELEGTLKLFRRLPTWNSLANIVVFFTTSMNETQLSLETQLVLEQLFHKSAYNAFVISYSPERNSIRSFSYFPYEGDNCATSVKNVHLVDECRTEALDGSLHPNVSSYHRGLYPKFPRKFHGCRLNVSVFPQAPYAVAESDGSIEKGLEVMMLIQIAKELNFKLAYRMIDSDIVNSYITTNATHGLYADILQG